MKLSDIFLTLFYGAASILIIFFIVRLITNPNKPDTVVVYGDETPVYAESNWWPWAYGPYNYWPYWGAWYSGGIDGGYGRWHHGHRWNGSRPWRTGGGIRGGTRPSGGARSGGRGGGGRH
jgi:hypothetical protein